VSLLAGAFVDLGVVAVLRTHADALAGEAQVSADHAGKAGHEQDTEDTNPFIPVCQEPVDHCDRDEEEDSGPKNPCFDSHFAASF
jgi:hypothetical protein